MASNIIQLAFNGETSATSDELVYKYDYGQKLQFTDLELPEVFEVHFAQQRLGRAVKQIGQNNIVDIPDGLLEKGSVYGWIFLHETANDGETEYEFKIPVKNRATPTDGEITPEQESVISQTIAVLVEAKDAALDAQEAAETAQTAAESAQSGAVTAQGLAEDAQEAAETAQSLAEAAQTASESAQTAAETAQGLAEDARDDAIEAKDLVLGMSATAVTLDPDEDATADYEDGLLTIGVPQGIQGVQGDTGNGIASAVLNADYTLTLTFTNGTTYTTPSIRGEQGIQGDTGVGISSISKTSTSGLVDTYTITFTDGQTTTFTVTNGAKGDTGNGIQSIAKTSTVGLVDTYTITYTDGTTATFTVTNGEKGDKGDTGEVSQADLDEAVTDLKSELSNIDGNLYSQRVKTSLDVKNIGHYTINSSGVMSANAGYDTFVVDTTNYKRINVDASAPLKIMGYFSSFPSAGSQTINSGRKVDYARGLMSVPDGCNYLAICLTASDSPYVKATNTETPIYTQMYNISPQMTNFAQGGQIDADKNLIYPSALVNNRWVNTSSGGIAETSYSYCCSGYVEIEAGEKYTWCSSNKPYSFGFYDEDYNTTGDFGTLSSVDYVTAPNDAKYIAYSWSGLKANIASPMVIKGSTPVSTYEEPTITKVELLNSDYATKEYVDSHGASNVSLELPTSYELVVGDTFELFWKGVINAVDYENFFVKVVCDIGKNYTRKFECTPMVGDVGTHQCKISLYNNYHSLIVEKTIDLIVKAKATSPASEKVVLYVGDSLANSGYVPDEFNRRLVGSGGTLAGDGLSNLIFIGDKQSVDRHIKYVGNGGWTWVNYNSAMSTNAFMWITANAHGKTSADQHSVYEASNGTQWKLETIEENRIKIIRTSGSSALPSTGTLTWVSGGNDTSNIVYTASEQAAGNPFWDEDTSAISFANFASEQGVSQIDYIYVLLGWNNTGAEETTFKQNVRTFLDNVLSDYANCKIVLLGLQIPARDGLAYNYGQNAGVLSDYQQAMQHVFDLNKWYYDITQEVAYADNVTFVNIAGQFDTEHNMPTRTGYYNTRNTESFRLQYNGVHPAQSGYYQIADACYRDFVHKLQ